MKTFSNTSNTEEIRCSVSTVVQRETLATHATKQRQRMNSTRLSSNMLQSITDDSFARLVRKKGYSPRDISTYVCRRGCKGGHLHFETQDLNNHKNRGSALLCIPCLRNDMARDMEREKNSCVSYEPKTHGNALASNPCIQNDASYIPDMLMTTGGQGRTKTSPRTTSTS